MLHRHANPAPKPGPYAEAVTRLATIRRSLRLVDPHGGGPASDLDSSSGAILGAAIAGLDALTALREQPAPAEASREMVDRIRRELAEISGIVLR
ncbi:MAG: hypothetical protein ABIS23_05580 [Sphingomicrobium sp.]